MGSASKCARLWLARRPLRFEGGCLCLFGQVKALRHQNKGNYKDKDSFLTLRRIIGRVYHNRKEYGLDDNWNVTTIPKGDVPPLSSETAGLKNVFPIFILRAVELLGRRDTPGFWPRVFPKFCRLRHCPGKTVELTFIPPRFRDANPFCI